jgi:protein LSM14
VRLNDFKNKASYDAYFYLFVVRSYGTEDRVTEKQVGPRSEVYEYIVFRGTDIKDLHVSKAPKPINTVNQDPSILQVCDFFK